MENLPLRKHPAQKVLWICGVLIATALIAEGCWLYWVFTEVKLDDLRLWAHRRLFGCPPRGTPAYFWFCAKKILERWVFCFFPYGVGILASSYALLRLLGFRIANHAISPWSGFAVIVLCICSSVEWFTNVGVGPAIIAMESPWPAFGLLIWPPIWRYALIILFFWAAFVVCGLGVRYSSSLPLISGLALTALIISVMYQHGCLAGKTRNR